MTGNVNMKRVPYTALCKAWEGEVVDWQPGSDIMYKQHDIFGHVSSSFSE